MRKERFKPAKDCSKKIACRMSGICIRGYILESVNEDGLENVFLNKVLEDFKCSHPRAVRNRIRKG